MEDPSSQNLLLQFVLLFILTVLNAFFSATEMAMVSLNRARVEQKAEEGDRRYIRLLKVLENPNHFLSTIQVGITLITILSGASLTDTSRTCDCLLAWEWRNSTSRGNFSILGIFDLYFHRFWGIIS
ncbi:CBS domain membrane protein [Streptococcus pneumoniae]|nr:CBS domain membrane protein [Streptococcus pneumoniae]